MVAVGAVVVERSFGGEERGGCGAVTVESCFELRLKMRLTYPFSYETLLLHFW